MKNAPDRAASAQCIHQVIEQERPCAVFGTGGGEWGIRTVSLCSLTCRVRCPSQLPAIAPWLAIRLLYDKGESRVWPPGREPLS